MGVYRGSPSPNILSAVILLISTAILGIDCQRNFCDSDTCRRISQRIGGGIDSSVDPCDDFYEFSCGNWMRRNPIPEDRTWWSPWSIARIQLKKQIRGMLEEPYDPRRHPVPSVKQAMNLYRGCLDQGTREEAGLGPMKQILDKIGGWPIVNRQWSENSYVWESAYVYLRSRLGLNYIISMYVDIDSKDTSRRIIYLDRPGLGLGRSELQNPRESPDTQRLVAAYKNYIRSSAKLLNFERRPTSLMVKDINDMMKFESRLARASSDFVDRRDHFGLYNKMTIRQLQQRFPGIRWLPIIKRIFKYAKVTITDRDEVVVQDAAYYRNLPNILRTTSSRTIANYIGWRYVLSYSDYTTRNFTDTYFTYQKVAYGQRKPEKTWETCYAIVDSYFPYAIGRLYVDNYFNVQSKNSVERLIREVKSAFTKELDQYEWMDSTTRRRSKEKLNEMLANVAFQSFIKNDTELEKYYKGTRPISPEKFFSAIVNLDRWQVVTSMRKLRKRVQRTSPKLSGPATVNAFNYFDLNYIQFPAGVLQSPFFTFGGPASVNFGAIGKTIGHEIIHGFDDEGKQYDKFGNLKNWWSSRTEREYNRRTECFINEYDNFREPITDLFVNGVDTQGENLADNGGLRMSFRAYKNFVSNFGTDVDPHLPGELSRFSSDQLFFLSFASIWCENERRESMRNTIKYGSHSPSRFRVIGTVINSKEFSEAFRCPTGSPMNPRKKCILW